MIEKIRSTLGRDKELLKNVFNSFFSLSEFITVQEQGSMYCPFHDDERGGKPSAKFYRDDDGIERIYCYSEGRQYTAYDCVVKLLNKNPLQYLLTNVSLMDLEESIAENQINNNKFEEESIECLFVGKAPADIIELVCVGAGK